MRSIYRKESPSLEKELFGIKFPNPVGLAGGLDKNGVGLGLYASKKIIDAHCGEIFVKSYNDNRNSFGFRIPIAQCDSLVDKIIRF
jgi:dihydroorotate dehydrogenase